MKALVSPLSHPITASYGFARTVTNSPTEGAQGRKTRDCLNTSYDSDSLSTSLFFSGRSLVTWLGYGTIDEWWAQTRKCTNHKMSNFSRACANNLFVINLSVTFLLFTIRRGGPVEGNRGLVFFAVLKKALVCTTTKLSIFVS